MNCFALSNAIHEFHNGISRELYKTYTFADEDTAVAGAIANGILKREEVPDDVFKALGNMIRFFRER